MLLMQLLLRQSALPRLRPALRVPLKPLILSRSLDQLGPLLLQIRLRIQCVQEQEHRQPRRRRTSPLRDRKREVSRFL